jgi:hypothetical protein
MSKKSEWLAENFTRTISLEEELNWICEVGYNSDFVGLCERVFEVMQKLHRCPSGSFTILRFDDWGGNRIDLDLEYLRQVFFNYESLGQEFEIEGMMYLLEEWTPESKFKTIVIEDEEDETRVMDLGEKDGYVAMETLDEWDKTS